MEMSNNTKVLAVFAIMLAVVKYAFMPVFAWQDDIVEQIEQTEKRNRKSQALIDGQMEMMSVLGKADQNYQQLRQTYPSYPDSASFRLQTQIDFEALLKDNQLIQKRLLWRGEDEQVFDNLYQSSFNVNFRGKVKEFALLQNKLASEYGKYRIRNMSVTVRGQKEKSLGLVQASFTVVTTYWQGG